MKSLRRCSKGEKCINTSSIKVANNNKGLSCLCAPQKFLGNPPWLKPIYQVLRRHYIAQDFLYRYDQDVVKNLMPLIVNVLESLDLAYTESSEFEVHTPSVLWFFTNPFHLLGILWIWGNTNALWVLLWSFPFQEIRLTNLDLPERPGCNWRESLYSKEFQFVESAFEIQSS